MEIVTIPLDMLEFDPNNARTHPEKNIEAVKKSLTAFGQVEPLVVQESSSVVIGGNARLQAMRELGWTEASADMVTSALLGALRVDAAARAEFYSLVH